MPNEMQSDIEQIEQLTLLVEQLTQEKEQLTLLSEQSIREKGQLQAQLNESLEQLAQLESHNSQLTSIIDASAEDLQPFGAAWIKPSTVRAVTYQHKGGIHIDGIPTEVDSSAPTEQIAAQMQSFAQRINQQNAERRAKARRKKTKTVEDQTTNP